MKALIFVFCSAFFSISAGAVAPGIDSIQMQRLIQTSQEQLKVAQDLLGQAKHDAASLERAAGVLDQLSRGLNQEIQPLQGTSVYDQAILKLQEEQAGALKAGATPAAQETEEQARARQNFYQFQLNSHKAELEDLINHDKLSQALGQAQPGFVPKLQAQTELGQWQTEVRISAQLTELLTAIHNLRKDVGGTRLDDRPQGFGLFLSGAADHSKKLHEGVNSVP